MVLRVLFADAGIKVKRKQPPGQAREYKTLDTAVAGMKAGAPPPARSS
jgi:hypothetical protein